MGKHGKLVNVLMKLHFLEDSQRSIKEIRKQIERYEKRDLTPGWCRLFPFVLRQCCLLQIIQGSIPCLSPIDAT